MEDNQLLFEDQAKSHGLKQTSIDSLVEEGYDSTEAVATLTASDLEELSLNKGQKGLLRKWAAELTIKDATADGAGNDKTGSCAYMTSPETLQHEESRTVSKTPNTWDRPMCLVDGQDCQLNVNEAAIEAIAKVPGPIVVVGVVGLYRTGKSFLLNLLAGQTGGFPLGSAIHACTKGIWAWLIDHPTRRNTSLLLLDTEGLGDVEKGDDDHDMRIFTLTLLLISTMVFNSKGTIDNKALEELNFVSNIADHVKVKTEKDDGEDDDYVRFFPSFVWAVRDFMLELDAGPEAYLERALEAKEGRGEKAQKFNRSRECIRRYFPTRTCFCFPLPLTDASRMKNLETMAEGQLAPDFRKVAEEFKEYIYAKSETKRVQREEVTGSAFGGLVMAYVKALKSGETPCIQNAVDTTATIENQKAINSSLGLYTTRMAEKTVLPTESLELLSQAHHECEKKAIEAYLKAAIFDRDHKFQKQLQEEIMNEYNKICQQNEKASMSKCSEILEDLSKEMDEKLQRGKYTVPGGYDSYKTDLSTLEENFKRIQNKGVKAEESWDQFKKSKNKEGTSIMMADKNMTDQQKKMEEDKVLRESEERARKLDEALARKIEQLESDKRGSHEEHVRQLTLKMEQDQERFQKEIAMMREEYQKLLQHGYERKAEDMNRRIDKVVHDVHETKQERDPGLLKKAFQWLW